MNRLFKIKKQHIDLLQKYNSWGKSKEDIGDLLDVLEVADIDLGSLKEKSSTNTLQTKILIDANKIVAPIHIDNDIELPIAELFIDNNNFVVYTTQCIYNCRNAITEKIDYTNIVGVDEDLINDTLRDMARQIQIIELKLIIANGNRVPISIEYGIPFRPIVYFLTKVKDLHTMKFISKS